MRGWDETRGPKGLAPRHEVSPLGLRSTSQGGQGGKFNHAIPPLSDLSKLLWFTTN